MFSFTAANTTEGVEIKFKGDLDIDGTEIIEEEIMPILDSFTSVKISFLEVPFIDSSGMGLLLNLINTVKERGSEIYITDVKKEVMEVFELLQIPEIVGEGVFCM